MLSCRWECFSFAAGVVFPENNTMIFAFLVVYRPGRCQRHLDAGLVRKTPKGRFYPKRRTTINRELSSKKLARPRHVVTYMWSVKHRGRGFIGNSSGIRSSKIIHTQKVQFFGIQCRQLESLHSVSEIPLYWMAASSLKPVNSFSKFTCGVWRSLPWMDSMESKLFG